MRWEKNNPERRKELNKIWKEKNREHLTKKTKEYNNRNPIKYKARNYARNNNFRREFCLLCLLENKKGDTKHFHHTDYEANLGFSVCMEHHKIADGWLRGD